MVAGLIVATGFLYFVWTWLGVRHDLKFVKPVKVVLVEEHHEGKLKLGNDINSLPVNE